MKAEALDPFVYYHQWLPELCEVLLSIREKSEERMNSQMLLCRRWTLWHDRIKPQRSKRGRASPTGCDLLCELKHGFATLHSVSIIGDGDRSIICFAALISRMRSLSPIHLSERWNNSVVTFSSICHPLSILQFPRLHGRPCLCRLRVSFGDGRRQWRRCRRSWRSSTVSPSLYSLRVVRDILAPWIVA